MTTRYSSALPESAWLIHFKRTEPDRGLPLYGNGDSRDLEREAFRIRRALEQQPRRLKTLRGIDICGVERWQPLWVSAVTLFSPQAGIEKDC